jgi:hypothetical protein
VPRGRRDGCERRRGRRSLQAKEETDVARDELRLRAGPDLAAEEVPFSGTRRRDDRPDRLEHGEERGGRRRLEAEEGENRRAEAAQRGAATALRCAAQHARRGVDNSRLRCKDEAPRLGGLDERVCRGDGVAAARRARAAAAAGCLFLLRLLFHFLHLV